MKKDWEVNKCNFVSDDGSLPSFEVRGLSPQEMDSILILFRDLAQGFQVPGPLIFNKKLNREVSILEVSNPCELLADGVLEAFHFCLSGITYENVVLPEIGFFFFSDRVEIDYRMGTQWSEDKVRAFFDLLRMLTRRFTNSRIVVGEDSNIPCPEKFISLLE